MIKPPFTHGQKWRIGKTRCAFFENRPFGIRAVVLWNNGPKELVEALVKMKVADESEEREGFIAYTWSFEDEGKDPSTYTPPDELVATHALMFAKPLDVLRTSYGTNVIAHEAMHLIGMAFRNRGLELNDESDEAYAYCIADAVEEITNMMGLLDK